MARRKKLSKNLSFEPQDWALLEALAASYGLTPSAYLRMQLKTIAAASLPQVTPEQKKKGLFDGLQELVDSPKVQQAMSNIRRAQGYTP